MGSAVFRSVTEADLPAAMELVGRYLPGSEAALAACVARAPELALVCVEDGAVLGVCFAAVPHEGEGVVLDGIAVEEARAGHGLGSELLAAFEARVAEAGFARISLASAEGYVEHFYEKNGYEAVEFLVTAPEEPPLDGSLEVLRWRGDGEATMINLHSTRGYTQAEKERIRTLTSAHEVLLIFEKRFAPQT